MFKFPRNKELSPSNSFSPADKNPKPLYGVSLLTCIFALNLLNPVFCPLSLFLTIPSTTIELTPYFSVPVYSLDLISKYCKKSL